MRHEGLYEYAHTLSPCASQIAWCSENTLYLMFRKMWDALKTLRATKYFPKQTRPLGENLKRQKSKSALHVKNLYLEGRQTYCRLNFLYFPTNLGPLCQIIWGSNIFTSTRLVLNPRQGWLQSEWCPQYSSISTPCALEKYEQSGQTY